MKVLIPLDGPELLQSALPVARQLLRVVPAAELCLLQVLNPARAHGSQERPDDFTIAVAGSRGPVLASPRPRLVESHGQMMERLHTEAIEWLEGLAAKELPGATVSATAVWSEKPAKAIVQEATAVGADLVAMATHGRNGVAHFINGSVTEDVIRTSAQPVLVVGPGFVPIEGVSAPAAATPVAPIR